MVNGEGDARNVDHHSNAQNTALHGKGKMPRGGRGGAGHSRNRFAAETGPLSELLA